ncbi:hypothetical protein ERX46_10705 [Brumimicrobium glaciale]|uniref:ABC transporter ATPase n=1 Tax=Brumimicrobium glaciale TaxID=200475 RepID=A0A4Q4KJI0_9FLAO|nr:hypothetical protein [Brumimicrobium glaciale]RYM33402.1 hypothetical protein ERX46_10705 [Brumimicrobium glaciale]
MQISNKDLFTQFPDQSKVWLYQSDRALSKEEISKLENELTTFVEGWAAHGSKLWAGAKVLNPYFALVAVNDSLVPPSGCSVDASVHKMKDLGLEMGINFFDRMKVTIQEGEDLKQVHFSDLDNHQEALIFDPLITSLGELRAAWPRPIEESSFAHMVG